MTRWYVLTYAAIIAAESEDLGRLAELLGDAELLGKRLPMRYLMIVGDALRGWLDVCEGSPRGIERIVRSVARSRTEGESLHLTYTLLLCSSSWSGRRAPRRTSGDTRGALVVTSPQPALSRG